MDALKLAMKLLDKKGKAIKGTLSVSPNVVLILEDGSSIQMDASGVKLMDSEETFKFEHELLESYRDVGRTLGLK